MGIGSVMDKPAILICPSPALNKWLKDAGIPVGDDEKICRVVIDMKVGEVVHVYVERMGDDRIIKVTPPSMAGAVVEIGPANNG